MERLNIEALATLTTRDNAQLRTFPPDLIAAARTTATDVLGDLAGKSDKARKGVRFLHRLPRQSFRVVAHLDAGGAGGAARVDRLERGLPAAPNTA